MTTLIIILSWIGTALTGIKLIPQCYKIWKTKDTKSLSLLMIIILSLSAIVWIAFATLNIIATNQPKNFYGILVTNILVLISEMFILWFKIYNIMQKKEKLTYN